jgi:hypothetical protein
MEDCSSNQIYLNQIQEIRKAAMIDHAPAGQAYFTENLRKIV